MEAFLRAFLPAWLPEQVSFEVHPFQGKDDLLGKLESRLRGYSSWLPKDWRVVVVVDRDDDDCKELKGRLEKIADQAGLKTRTRAQNAGWCVVNRIAIEELEAWYFGDWTAVRAAYSRVSSSVPKKKGFRDSDAIVGGTWEAFERVMKRHGYFAGGLRKLEAARAIGPHVDPMRSASNSFKALCIALSEAVA